MFSCVVPGPQNAVHLSAHGSDIDNMPGASGPHPREQQLREPCGTEQIDLKLIARFFNIYLFYGPIEAKTGIIDQYINTSGLSQNGLHAGDNLRVE